MRLEIESIMLVWSSTWVSNIAETRRLLKWRGELLQVELERLWTLECIG